MASESLTWQGLVMACPQAGRTQTTLLVHICIWTLFSWSCFWQHLTLFWCSHVEKFSSTDFWHLILAASSWQRFWSTWPQAQWLNETIFMQAAWEWIGKQSFLHGWRPQLNITSQDSLHNFSGCWNRSFNSSASATLAMDLFLCLEHWISSVSETQPPSCIELRKEIQGEPDFLVSVKTLPMK